MTITRSATRPAARRAATATALAVALGLAAVSWVAIVPRTTGMDMGVATRLGSYPSFLVMWVTMMAAMMLPAAAPAVVRHARASGRVYAAPLFVASYLVVWTLVGALGYVAYRPHGTLVGVIAVAVGCYELTPMKRHCRGRCRDGEGSGFAYGLHCVGSTIGLMVLFTALGVMSLAWMVVISLVVLAQRLLPAKAAIDVPLALAIVGLGVWIIAAPMSVPWLTPGM